LIDLPPFPLSTSPLLLPLEKGKLQERKERKRERKKKERERRRERKRERERGRESSPKNVHRMRYR